jgi:hypothetical protein
LCTFTCLGYGKDVKLWRPWIWVYSKFWKANSCMSYTWHGFVVFVISISIKVYVIINVDFSCSVNMCVLSFTSQQCSRVKFIPHYCYWFKHHRNTEISYRLGHNHWPLRQKCQMVPQSNSWSYSLNMLQIKHTQILDML